MTKIIIADEFSVNKYKSNQRVEKRDISAKKIIKPIEDWEIKITNEYVYSLMIISMRVSIW